MNLNISPTNCGKCGQNVGLTSSLLSATQLHVFPAILEGDCFLYCFVLDVIPFVASYLKISGTPYSIGKPSLTRIDSVPEIASMRYAIVQLRTRYVLRLETA